MQTRTQFFFVSVVFFTLCGCATAAVVTQNITYQGVLTDSSGNPLNGNYQVAFRLYETATGGSPLATYGPLSIPVTKGLFSTPVNFDSRYYDGRALWIGIAVGSDTEMTPRQEVRPVPYALSLRPGPASFTTNGSGTSGALNAGVNVSASFPYNYGVRILTSGDNSMGLQAKSIGLNSIGVEGLSIRGIGVFGSSAEDVGVKGIGKNGGDFTTNTAGTSSNPNAGVNVSTAFPYNYGVRILTSGDNSMGLQAKSTGLNSVGVEGLSIQGIGVFGSSAADVGVKGKGKTGGYFTTNTEGTTYSQKYGLIVDNVYNHNTGIFLHTIGSWSPGIYTFTDGADSEGMSAITRGNYSPGVYIKTLGNDSVGLYSWSWESSGVVGVGTIGGSFTSHTGGADWNNLNPGVEVATSYDYNPGIQVDTIQNYSQGIRVSTSGLDSAGIRVGTTGQNSYGAYVLSDKASAIYAHTQRTDQKYGLYTPDYIYAKGTQYPAVDVAEYFPVTGSPEPGTVMIIGPEGYIQASTIAYDTRVMGIVSTDPAVSLGAKDTGNPGEVPIAVAGRVPCKVDASYGAIHPGDVLTTSPTPGHAMKAEPVVIEGVEIYKPSTTVGKALGTIESGTGTIEVLVTLQ